MSRELQLIEELEHWLGQAKYFESKLTQVEKRLEIVMRERDAYKAYIDRIVQLKAEALLTQPLPPILIDIPPRAGDTFSPVGSNAEGKVETPCQPTTQGKHICCWERKNPHRCILCCQCGKRCELVPDLEAIFDEHLQERANMGEVYQMDVNQRRHGHKPPQP